VASNNKITKNGIAVAVGVLLVLFGIWQLAEQIFGLWYADIWAAISLAIRIIWPLVIIAGGIMLMIAARKGNLSLPENRKLYRSTSNKKISGVCGGIAEYLAVDAAMVRVSIIVLAILCWYVIVPLYLMFWIIIPQGGNKHYNTWV
jgi:phage shock protein PspC (stress-responsive transcriptional regulator)